MLVGLAAGRGVWRGGGDGGEGLPVLHCGGVVVENRDGGLERASLAVSMSLCGGKRWWHAKSEASMTEGVGRLLACLLLWV